VTEQSSRPPRPDRSFRRRATIAPRREGNPSAAVAKVADLLADLRFVQNQQAGRRCREMFRSS
jgi:hypothetical protein